MATLAEMQEALVNADRAGATDDARKLANAIHEMRSAAPEQQQPQQSESGLSAAKRIIMGLADPIHGGAQLLTNALPKGLVDAGNRANNWLADKTGMVARLPEGGVDQQVRDREAAYKQARGPDAGIDWMRMLGNVASPANLAMAAAGPAAAATTLGRIGVGSGMGALSSATSPVGEGDFAAEKLKQMGVGAVGGAALPAAVAGLSRMVSPKASTDPALALLRSEGINPTIGQTLGGAWNKAEEKLTSTPIMGDAIQSARRRAETELNTAVANRALEPIGQKLPPGLSAQEAVAHVRTTLGDAYDQLLPRMTVQKDQAFNQQIGQLRQMVRTGSMDPKSATAFDRIVNADVLGKFKGQQAITGQTLKDIESDLGQQIARFGQSTDSDQRLVGQALKEVESALRDLRTRSNPQLSRELTAIDTGYANFKRLQKAAGYVGADEGLFSANQLQSAVRAADRSKDKRAFAEGDALMQDLSGAAKSRLGNKVPDSGTAQRLMMGAGGLASGALHPAIPASLIGGAAMYSPPAQALLRGLVANRPQAAQPIAGLLNQSAPMLGPAGGLLGLEFLNQ